jgi:hypothetical protein
MSKEMKYVIDKNNCPFLFSIATQHSEIGNERSLSAGFCRIRLENHKFTAECYGESVSLKKKSNPGDESIIELMFNEY